MSQFLNVFAHLLPRTGTWALTFSKQLRQLFAGLAAPLDDIDPSKSPRAFADAIYSDIFPSSTRQTQKWLTQFGLEKGIDSTADALQLTAAWQAQGGQSPKYIQDTLQAAGFQIYVHEWWKKPTVAFSQLCAGDALAQCGEPQALASGRSFTRFVRDPRLYTTQPLISSWQASALSDQPQCTPTGLGFAVQPQCNAFLQNEPGYLVNLDLTQSAPPAVPDDSDQDYPIHWPYFFYLGGVNFTSRVSVPSSRRAELERLVLKLRPLQNWVVMFVDYTADSAPDGAYVFDDGSFVVFDDGSYAI